MGLAFKKIKFEDGDIEKFQLNVENSLNPIIRNPLVDGFLLKDITLGNASINTINHGLGRELIGWFVVGQSASSIIWDSQSTNTFKNLTLLLNCSANVTVSLWVF